jgi:hypothetical protein
MSCAVRSSACRAPPNSSLVDHERKCEVFENVEVAVSRDYCGGYVPQ